MQINMLQIDHQLFLLASTFIENNAFEKVNLRKTYISLYWYITLQANMHHWHADKDKHSKIGGNNSNPNYKKTWKCYSGQR